MAAKGANVRDALQGLTSWGRQTIAFTMSVRAHEIGKPIEDTGRARDASKEVDKITRELWNAAHRECKQPAELPEMTMKFVKRVLDWAEKHRA